MVKKLMGRKEFFKTAAKLGAGACLCGAAGGLEAAVSRTQAQPAKPGDKSLERAAKRMEFADHWVKRFFDAVDQTLDEPTRRTLMELNGKNCFRAYLQSSKQDIKPVDFATWAKKISEGPKRDDVSIEGNVIRYQFSSSAETGAASPEGICLCPVAESKPAGMSPTYCYCSVGYVKESFELRFNRKVDVELTDSVLRSGKRCKFKITVL